MSANNPPADTSKDSAFPVPGMPAYSPEGIPLNPWAGHGWAVDPQAGMTLRDYFAAKALEGFLHRKEYDDVTFPDAATDAYRYADAMLAERSKAEGDSK